MTISLDQIKKWLEEPSERASLEFKEAKQNFAREKLFKYCVAMANEGGGHLVLGITDKNPREVVGTSAFQNPGKIENEVFTKLKFSVGVFEVNHPDGRVVIFQIPSRPKGTAYKCEGAYLTRSGANLVEMSEDRLRTIFDEGKPDYFDELVMTGLDAQKVIDLLDTEEYFELRRRPYPSKHEDVLNKLESAGLVEQSEGLFSIRRIGALLLARSLFDFDKFSCKAPRVIVHKGLSITEASIDWICEKGYAVGFNELIDFVMEQLLQYENMKLVPEDAVRELIVNALIHQDFTIADKFPTIDIYSDRIEISNPGVPMLEIDHFIDEAEHRNESLARLMRRMYLCEERSVGIDRVIAEVEALQLPAPRFRAAHNITRAVLFGARDFSKLKKVDLIRACYQHCVFRWLHEERMTNGTLQKRFGLLDSERAAVSSAIRDTVRAKYIMEEKNPDGSIEHGCYVPYWA